MQKYRVRKIHCYLDLYYLKHHQAPPRSKGENTVQLRLLSFQHETFRIPFKRSLNRSCLSIRVKIYYLILKSVVEVLFKKFYQYSESTIKMLFQQQQQQQQQKLKINGTYQNRWEHGSATYGDALQSFGRDWCLFTLVNCPL